MKPHSTAFRGGNFFAQRHPAVIFFYYSAVMIFTAVLAHPAARLISLFCSVTASASSRGLRAEIKTLKLLGAPALIIALINPIFSHGGATVLTYLPSGNPLTLESIVYGISSAVLFTAALNWFLLFSESLNADKIIYLFSAAAPSAAVLIALALRLIPDFKRTIDLVTEAKDGLFGKTDDRNALQRIKRTVGAVSGAFGIMLEASALTAQSMKSRGYGLKGRTAYTDCVFTAKDKISAVFIACEVLYISAGAAASAFSFTYFPSLSSFTPCAASAVFYTAFAALCLMPAAINAAEEIKWKASYSEM